MRSDLRAWGVWALILAVLAVATVPAQKPRKEEEEDTPPAKKPKVEEEDTKPAPSKVLDVDDDGKAAAAPRAASVDLARAARDARHPDVKALYAALAYPADRIRAQLTTGAGAGGEKATTTTLRVAPVPVYVTDLKALKEALTVRTASRDSDVLGAEMSIGPRALVELTYYEQVALEAVKAFLAEPLAKFDPSHVRHLSRLDQLIAADQALSAVARWHQSARVRGARPGDGWSAVEGELREALADVLVQQMDTLADSKAWDAALDLTGRLADIAPRQGRPGYKRALEGLTRVMTQALADPVYSKERVRDLRDRLRRMTELFPEAAAPVAAQLRDQAKRLVDRAEEQIKSGDKTAAGETIRQAEEVAPEYHGLRTVRAKIGTGDRPLRVAMREQPKFLSPGFAVTDSERRCLDLIFEPLVALVPDDDGRLYYAPALADARPRVLPLGREFHLPVDARWSDGQQVTAADVRATVNWMQDGKKAGRLAAWGDLLNRVVVGGDARRVELSMKHGFLDPMSLMAFRVLPRGAEHDRVAFAKAPIGTGPFQFEGVKLSDVVFAANPYYGAWPGRGGHPRVSEVRVSAPADVAKAFADRTIDVAFDLSAKQAGELRKGGKADVRLPAKGALNRRITFLAVNHHRPALANPKV